jgi:hypothetical protein
MTVSLCDSRSRQELVISVTFRHRRIPLAQTHRVPAVEVAEPGAATAALFQPMAELSPGASVVVSSPRSGDAAQ